MNAMIAAKQMKSLHLDWPVGLVSGRVADLLIGLQDTLEDKGLVIDAPASEMLPGDQIPQNLAGQFRSHNEDLSLVGVRAELASRNADANTLMKMLDWRVPALARSL